MPGDRSVTLTGAIDPLRTSEVIRSAYQRYLRSLLPIRDSALAVALDAAIQNDHALTKGPLLEMTPPYAHGATLDRLLAEGVLHPSLREVAGPGLPFDRPLYQHQDEAIRKVAAGRNVVVATGTGSGKTESFLLPILNELSRQHADGDLGPGVRALLLYPMNALANDQVKRLRQVLAGAPHITFGRYTGDTRNSARDAKEAFEVENPGVVRLPNELLSREEMRATPPHFLLTNYAMLEYLLLRPLDVELFEGSHTGTWRFIVVDEAHVYDGAKGAELAMLMRRLVDRVAAGHQMQCIATSATVGGESNPASVTSFAQDLFNVPFEYTTEAGRQDLVRATRVTEPEGDPWGPLGPDQYAALMGSPAGILVEAKRAGCTHEEAGRALSLERRVHQLKSLLATGPRPLQDVAKQLFPGESDAVRQTTELVALGASTRDGSGAASVSARYHLFARATEGAFACLSDDGPHVSLARRERCGDCSAAAFEFGACKRCGTVHLAGSVERLGSHSVFRARRTLAERPTWLALTAGVGLGDEDEEVLDEQKVQDVDQALLCARCGAIYADARSRCDNAGCASEELRIVQRMKGSSSELSRCVTCGGRAAGLVRLFESGNDAAVAVLSTALYQELPPDDSGPMTDRPGQGRKLLLFSDSRQAAAYFAPYLEDSYSSLQRRRFVLQGLTAGSRDGEGMRSDDLVVEVAKAAESVRVFERRDTRQFKERAAGLWVHQELLALDERQSLEGLGLLQLRLERESGWTVPPALLQLGLDESEGWALLEELVRTLKQQGAVTTSDDVDASDEAFAPRRGPIWVREQGSEPKRRVLSWLPTRGSNRRVDYLARVVAALGRKDDPATLLAGIWRLLTSGSMQEWLRVETQPGLGAVRRLDHTWLQWRLTTGSDQLHRCDRCRRIAALTVRNVCTTTGCAGQLEPWRLPDADDSDHYRVLYRTMLPVPMKVQEHTAQWSNEEAGRIQQQFVKGELNALSCSTTFELGVDVGELQSVVLRNMPPTTANYVQRAGRAGRRTDSAALVLTYAQRRSHDLTRFAEPERMIAGDVRAPYIPLGNERIDRRHAHSVALAAFFRHHHSERGAIWRTAGEFFTTGEDGVVPADLVEAFLSPPPAGVKASLQAVLPRSVQEEMGLDSDDWVEELTRLLGDIRDELAQDLEHYDSRREEAAAARKYQVAQRFQRAHNTVSKRELLGLLANKNVLPKYGFPVDSVELRTDLADSEYGKRLDLSRDLGAAIYEYAPGAEIVAGGFVWQSGGVYRLPDRELLGRYYAVCGRCGLYRESDEPVDALCPGCSTSAVGAPRQYVVPSFGFVASKGERRRPGQRRPRRAWNGATYVVATSADSEPQVLLLADGASITATTSERGELIAVSHGATGAGFMLCAWCGWGTSHGLGPIPRSHRRLVGRDSECSGPLELRTLAHKYQTDVLELRLDPITSQFASPSALLSTVYALLESASQLLEISRDDIDGALHHVADDVTTIVLFDAVPGGAGHVGQVAASLRRVLEEALRKVESCECGAETSCYRCLRVFRNERFHDELSRGAARDLLARLLGSTPTASGLPRFALADVPADGHPGERMIVAEVPTEVFARVQPGQLDLHEGRLCIVDAGVLRMLGSFTLSEDGGYVVAGSRGDSVSGDIADLRLIAAAV